MQKWILPPHWPDGLETPTSGDSRGLLGLFRCPWRFSRRAILPSLLVAWLLCSHLCRGPAQHFPQTVNVSLCFTTHTTVSPGLVPLFTTNCQGQAVLADGPTSSPHSTEPLHARSFEILSWWLSGHLSALAFLESSCPFRYLLPDLVLSPLSTPCSSVLSTGQPCVPGFCF